MSNAYNVVCDSRQPARLTRGAPPLPLRHHRRCSIGILFNDTILQGKQIYHFAPGDTNSILDVVPVRVGHANFKGGSYYVNNGQQSFPTTLPTTVNSGVTAILPLGFGASNGPRKRRSSGNEGNEFNTYVPAGFFSLNGCGEMANGDPLGRRVGTLARTDHADQYRERWRRTQSRHQVLVRCAESKKRS